jgi:nucleoid-associated protein YgaU
MAFSVTSRYELDTNGQTASPKGKATTNYYLYRVVQGDTMLNLAARSLGSDRRWWEIADINPQVKYPEDIVPGQVLRLPR